MAAEIKEPENLLVLCVDRDDDIGTKAKVETPIIGREAVVEAAIKLISADPEEADANTMFESVRILDYLQSRSKGEKYEVAVVAGSPSDEFEADRKISIELQKILQVFPAEAVILVSDGFTDQAVAPIIESFLPIISVHRFAVKHSESLEVGWYIFYRYLRSLFIEPRYKKWTLGLPGITFILFTLLYSLSIFYPNFPLAAYASISLMLIFGFAMIIKGFGLDRAISYILSEVVSNPYILINVFGNVTGLVICLLGINQGLSAIAMNVPKDYLRDLMSSLSHTNLILAAFLEESTLYFVIGFSMVFIGRILYYYFRRSGKIWSNTIGIAAAIVIGETLRRSASLLRMVPQNLTSPPAIDFFIWIAVGTIVLVVCTLTMRTLRNRFADKFTYTEENQ
ncbi:DUF373 family protein [Candidatus Bathyarchaeota archaeon]|nr:DUF373 family protein [Candidatus Bathyarchaeota archaeon]